MEEAARQRVLTKKKIHDLLAQVNPNERIDGDVENVTFVRTLLDAFLRLACGLGFLPYLFSYRYF